MTYKIKRKTKITIVTLAYTEAGIPKINIHLCTTKNQHIFTYPKTNIYLSTQKSTYIYVPPNQHTFMYVGLKGRAKPRPETVTVSGAEPPNRRPSTLVAAATTLAKKSRPSVNNHKNHFFLPVSIFSIFISISVKYLQRPLGRSFLVRPAKVVRSSLRTS